MFIKPFVEAFGSNIYTFSASKLSIINSAALLPTSLSNGVNATDKITITRAAS